MRRLTHDRNHKFSNGDESGIRPTGLRRVLAALIGISSRQEGVSAIEFALILPAMIVALLYLGRLGVLIHQKMEMEQILRVGAEAAIRDLGTPEVDKRMQAAAVEKGFKLWTGPQPLGQDELALITARSCACPEELSTNIYRTCNYQCPSQRPVIVTYDLRASYVNSSNKLFDVSLLHLGFDAGGGGSNFLHRNVTVR